MTRREELKYLLERSRRFYETALIQVERGFYDLAVFSLEQALQLYLKAQLLKLGVDYPRVHSPRRLLELISEVAGSRGLSELLSRFAVELGSIEDAYITARYVAREYGREEVEKLRRVVEEIVNAVEQATG